MSKRKTQASGVRSIHSQEASSENQMTLKRTPIKEA